MQDSSQQILTDVVHNVVNVTATDSPEQFVNIVKIYISISVKERMDINCTARYKQKIHLFFMMMSTYILAEPSKSGCIIKRGDYHNIGI